MNNEDKKVVKGFGEEWSRFSQGEKFDNDRNQIFSEYFSVFPWEALPVVAVGADIGCGSGRWAHVVAPRVGVLHCVDASPEALEVARHNLKGHQNIQFKLASVGKLPFDDGSLDFVYSLGVLHHVPDTLAAISEISRTLKPGAPFLVYLYYAFDNRSLWFYLLWKVSDCFRYVISRLPKTAKNLVCDLCAAVIYWPLARTGRALEKLGLLPASWPLASYRNRSFYVMRTDALDRFGTRLEQRFSANQIRTMLEFAGFADIEFSDASPYWCVVGIKEAQ